VRAGELGIGEITHNCPRDHRETQDGRCGLGEPLEQRPRVGRLAFLAEKLQQPGTIGIDLIVGLEQVQQCRIDLPFARQARVEVLASAPPPGRQRSLAQQHRSGRNSRTPRVAPGRHAPGQEQRPQTPLLEVLRRLGPDRAGPPRRPAYRRVAEQQGQPDRPRGKQRIND
jgi:hypothetical protein